MLAKKYGIHDRRIVLLIPAQLLIRTSSYHAISLNKVRVNP
jgi:hypothetical protein